METRKYMDQVEALEAHRNARRKDRGLSSFDYAEGAIRRGSLAGILGVFGFLSGHSFFPEFTWLFLLPAAGTAALAAQSFRLTYLRRLDEGQMKRILERNALELQKLRPRQSGAIDE